jgi:ATP-dependent helicase YprA (DUF1998 family)
LIIAASFQGKSYIVLVLDIKERYAHVRPISVDYFTKTRDDTDVDVVITKEHSHDGVAARGEVQVLIYNPHIR